MGLIKFKKMKINLEKLNQERINKFIELKRKGYNLKKIKKKRDKEKSKVYIKFVVIQIKKRRNKFYFKI
ncbi:MAG: hypothetical protein DSY60_01140 [Persephonella sp.]|nr:MAG: hypothetical protein DSY60_01140 [Persephonella sp.]